MAFDAATYQIDPLTLTEPRARLEYLRDFLRGLPAERFHIGSVARPLDREDCGTPACIAGWSMAIWQRPYSVFGRVGAELFGLGADDAHLLFFPATVATCGLGYSGVRPAHAAAVLDHLIRTGRVDWSVARKVEA